ncbi:YaeQ protein [compost metagenome]
MLHWIEVGQPDAERITWCSRRTERFSLVTYGNLRVWQTKVLDSVRTLKNINVVAVQQEALEELARDLPRSVSWSVMISDGSLFITDERGQHEIPLEWLAGER